MASTQHVLFDLPSRPPCKDWSLNTWKTRLLLNFKGIDYKTQWVEYPDIKSTLEPHVPANPFTGTWTVPTVAFPDGMYVLDSREIVKKIEQLHPEPSIHLDSPVLLELESIMGRLMGVIRPIYLPNIPKRLLNEASLDYWHTTRSKLVGMSLDQYERENGRQEAWAKAAGIIREVEALLTRTPEGPFFLGKTVSYADFVWVGLLLMLQRIGQDILDEFYEASGESQLHRNILEASAPWSERAD